MSVADIGDPAAVPDDRRSGRVRHRAFPLVAPFAAAAGRHGLVMPGCPSGMAVRAGRGDPPAMHDDPVPGMSPARATKLEPTMRLFEWLTVALAVLGAAILAFVPR